MKYQQFVVENTAIQKLESIFFLPYSWVVVLLKINKNRKKKARLDPRSFLMRS